VFWLTRISSFCALRHDFAALARSVRIALNAKSCPDTCRVEPKAEEDAVSYPTLAAKLKNQEPASQQEWGTHFYGEGQKEQMRGWQAVLPPRLKPGSLWQLPQT
jgi:hypothetical protein